MEPQPWVLVALFSILAIQASARFPWGPRDSNNESPPPYGEYSSLPPYNYDSLMTSPYQSPPYNESPPPPPYFYKSPIPPKSTPLPPFKYKSHPPLPYKCKSPPYKGVVKHMLLAKFKAGVSNEQINELIKGYANLVNLVPSMKAFAWGKDVSIENLNQGFTHIFESTFKSTQGIAEYISDPNHVEFANTFLPKLEKVLVVDYKPTPVHP